MSVKVKKGTQWYKFFYVATAMATAVYHKNVIKNMDWFWYKHRRPKLTFRESEELIIYLFI